VCGAHKWCALLVVASLASSAEAASLVAAAEAIFKSSDVVVQVGSIPLSSQRKALQALGASKVGEILVIRRAEHDMKDPGEGSLDAWVIPADKADLAGRISTAIEGKQRPKVGGSSEDLLLSNLVVYQAPVFTRVLESIDDLSVEKQIILYVVGIVIFFLTLCPCLKPILQAATMSLDGGYIDRSRAVTEATQDGGADEEEDDDEDDEEDEQEDAVLVKKRT